MSKWFSVATSVVAFVLSLLSFYLTWWRDDPRLVAVMTLFNGNKHAYEIGDEPEFTTLVAADFRFVNPGNKTVALLDLEWLAIRADQPTDGALERRCARSDVAKTDHRWHRVRVELIGDRHVASIDEVEEPIVLEPGRIVSLSPHFWLSLDLRSRTSAFELESCWRFTAMDYAGRIVVRTLPGPAIAFKGQGTRPTANAKLTTFRVL
jgi:hypothetical protein